MAVRLERHEANARAVAAYLAADPRVEWVSFAGFPDHPHHDLVQRYLHGRVPSIITFGAAGGYEAGTGLLRLAAAVQAAAQPRRRQVAGHPPGVDHPPPARPTTSCVAAGIRPETIRLSIGLEHVDDLIADIDQALTQATA